MLEGLFWASAENAGPSQSPAISTAAHVRRRVVFVGIVMRIGERRRWRAGLET
jgi:hypothetical protein